MNSEWAGLFCVLVLTLPIGVYAILRGTHLFFHPESIEKDSFSYYRVTALYGIIFVFLRLFKKSPHSTETQIKLHAIFVILLGAMMLSLPIIVIIRSPVL